MQGQVDDLAVWVEALTMENEELRIGLGWERAMRDAVRHLEVVEIAAAQKPRGGQSVGHSEVPRPRAFYRLED